MIKIITTLVCSFAAMLMLIIALATAYWLQWSVPSEGHNVVHFRGLFRQCWEKRDNITDDVVPIDGEDTVCGDWFEGGLPGKALSHSAIKSLVLQWRLFRLECCCFVHDGWDADILRSSSQYDRAWSVSRISQGFILRFQYCRSLTSA